MASVRMRNRICQPHLPVAISHPYWAAEKLLRARDIDGVKSPVLRKATDMEERRCGFVEHFNPKPVLIRCNCITFSEYSERHLYFYLSVLQETNNRNCF